VPYVNYCDNPAANSQWVAVNMPVVASSVVELTALELLPSDE